MKINKIMETMLFDGFTGDETALALKRLGGHVKNYARDECIYHTGDKINKMGLVLSGSVRIESLDIMGSRRIMGQSAAGDVFAEAYAYLPEQKLLVDVVAGTDSEVLFIGVDTDRSYYTETWFVKFCRNLLTIANMKSLMLSHRNLHTSPHGTRNRINSFLSTQSLQHDSLDFSIPFDRQQMADYLNLDRSALSRELCRMQKDGLIDFHKSHFRILTR